MAVFRVNKNKNFTVMSNYHLRDKSLTLKAKGLLSLMLSLPDNWDYSLNGLIAICIENETAIKSALEELKLKKYLIINKLQNTKGQFEYSYNIYEYPQEKPEVEKPEVENPALEVPEVENHTQLNTKELNTNNNICPSNDERLCKDFNLIWNLYPRKEGKDSAFKHYKAWLKGKKYAGETIKLSNKQMWYATKKYADLIEKNKTEKQYIKMGSTFFNEAILEYVGEEDE